MTVELAETKEPKQIFQPLLPTSMTFEDARVVKFIAFVPRDTDPKVLTESRYWINVAQRLNALDRITAVWDDRSAMAALRGMDASQSFVSLLLLDYKKLPGVISDGSEALVNFDIFYSHLDGYCCRRLSDNVLVIQGASSREKAIEELKAHPSFKV